MDNTDWQELRRPAVFYTKYIPLGNNKSIIFDIEIVDKLWRASAQYCNVLNVDSYSRQIIGEYSSLDEAKIACTESMPLWQAIALEETEHESKV